MMPAAKALRMMNMFLSGCNDGIDRVKSGKQTPITLATRIEKMAMILSRNAFSLLVHALVVVSHSLDCETAWVVRREKRKKEMEKNLKSEVDAIDLNWV